MKKHRKPVKVFNFKIGLLAALVLMLAAAFVLIPAARTRAAACQQPTTDYGTATMNVSIPETATYRIWTLMMVPNNTNNTYLLEVDGNNCYTVGGALASGSWVWVAHQNGNTGSKVDLSLSKGAHTLKLIGRQPDVKINRLVFASDLSCVPTGNGTNCDNPDDTTAPTASLTAPANSVTVAGTTNITASASDNTAVTKVEFYVNSTLLGTDTSSPYTYSWNTASTPNGAQLLTVKAYDAAGNVASDSAQVTVQNGDTQAPTTPTEVKASASAYNRVTLTWKASADSGGLKGYQITRNGVFLKEVGTVTSYQDDTVAPGTEYHYRVTAVDVAGNKSAPSAEAVVTTPDVSDTQAPSAPTRLQASASSTTQINLSWRRSSDNIGVTGYDVYRGSQKIATVTTTSFGDTGLKAGTKYSYTVRAKDAAGNTSSPSNTASATTKRDRQRRTTIQGKVLDSSTNRPLRYALVELNVSGQRHLSLTNRHGAYTLRNLEPGKYSVTYRAFGYNSKSKRITVQDSKTQTVNDVSLQKKSRNR